MVGIGLTVDSNTVMVEKEVGAPMKVGCLEVSHLLELGATVVLGMAGNHGVPIHSGGHMNLGQVDRWTGGQVVRQKSWFLELRTPKDWWIGGQVVRQKSWFLELRTTRDHEVVAETVAEEVAARKP